MFTKTVIGALLASSAFAAVVPAKRSSWTPTAGEKWQIILSGEPVMSGGLSPEDATVWDLDLQNTDASTISAIKEQGKGVICYFSAGTSEQGRPDLGGLDPAAVGAGLPDWPGENWLDIRSDNVYQIMAGRIQQAAEKGCDAIDPDNMDGYSNQNGGGFNPPLTQEDSIAFLQKLSSAASSAGLLIGLKNAQEIVPQVGDLVQFAVNEECSASGDCSVYEPWLSAGKPIFHIEYPNGGGGDGPSGPSSGSGGDGGDSPDNGDNGDDGDDKKKPSSHATKPKSLADYCVSGFSTVLKNLSLDGYVQYCDGSTVTTPTTGDSNRKAHR